MSQYARPLAGLIRELSKLPGIGGKTAQRLAFHILSLPDREAEALAQSILKAKAEMKYCSVCGNLTDRDPCEICSDPSRDRSVICVVEQARDVAAMERMKEYRGMYHVLHGAISPMDGIGPDKLRIAQLVERIKTEGVREVILATNPDVEGEATASYIAKLLRGMPVRVTRIAHGIPIGGNLEFIDEMTLFKAMQNRRDMD